MSVFELAITSLLKDEGGFVDDPDDPGGATNFGITLNSLRNVNQGMVNASKEDLEKLTIAQATNFYKVYWWDKYNYSQIQNQSVARKIFNLAVNMGADAAHKILQRACWSIFDYECIADDGELGDKTISMVNTITLTAAVTLLAAIKSEAAGHYRVLMAKNSKLEKFKNGWLKRAYE